VQTDKLSKRIGVILYGREFWDDVIDFKPFAEWGAIAEQDLDLLRFAETPSEAFELLRVQLTDHIEPASSQEAKAPGLAKTRG
jgi:predicted Rossmann-fold nucleotide-binding protein